MLVLSGRAHYYEGYSMAQITYPVRALAFYGIKTLVLTNAAGGIRPSLNPGHFLLLKDHINLMGENPLRGPLSPAEQHDPESCIREDLAPSYPRFVDMSKVYDPKLRELFKEASSKTRFSLATRRSLRRCSCLCEMAK